MRKESLFKIITILLSIFVMIIVFEIGVRFYESTNPVQTSDKGMYKYNNEIGWVLVDGVYSQTHQDFKAEYSVKNGSRLTKPSGQNNKKVVNFYGDSFGFGTGMADEYTIESFFAALNIDYKVNNYSVAGYGPLQYRMSYNSTKSKDLNIFLIFTGNDYKDIQRDKIEWGPYKPVLVLDGNSYRVLKPASDFKLMLSASDSNKFQIKSFNFIKNKLKNIPFIVKIRDKFMFPDKVYVNESIRRFNHVFNDIDKNSSLFVILPSISIVRGISTNDNEGYFKTALQQYLMSNNFHYVDLFSSKLLDSGDYWKHEGHNNIKGNEKIASIIDNYLKKRR
jgi:hypothetical protein